MPWSLFKQDLRIASQLARFVSLEVFKMPEMRTDKR